MNRFYASPEWPEFFSHNRFLYEPIIQRIKKDIRQHHQLLTEIDYLLQFSGERIEINDLWKAREALEARRDGS